MQSKLEIRIYSIPPLKYALILVWTRAKYALFQDHHEHYQNFKNLKKYLQK